jgi:hypothetical protein
LNSPSPATQAIQTPFSLASDDGRVVGGAPVLLPCFKLR